MKTKNIACLRIVFLFAAITLSNCAKTSQNDFSQYNFSLNNTLSIFLLNNGKDYYFCIPVQYMGDYQISRFDFDKGNIQIDNYNILLKRDTINISVYLNETADEDGNTVENFNRIYLEKNGKILVSKMDEPLSIKNNSDYTMNHYYIFIEKYLTDNDMKNIINEYERGNAHSQFAVWYDITIDNEEQNGCGMMDNFDFYNGLALDSGLFPPNLNFFKVTYLQR